MNDKFVVPDPLIEKVDGKTRITLDKHEAETLLLWLDVVNPGWLSDHEYLYFIKFKRQLALMTKVTSNVTITPVAEEKPADEKKPCWNHKDDNNGYNPFCILCNPNLADREPPVNG